MQSPSQSQFFAENKGEDWLLKGFILKGNIQQIAMMQQEGDVDPHNNGLLVAGTFSTIDSNIGKIPVEFSLEIGGFAQKWIGLHRETNVVRENSNPVAACISLASLSNA